MFRRHHQANTNRNQDAYCQNGFRNKFEKLQQHFFDGQSPFSHRMGANEGQVAANILEHADYYQIQLFAAARQKQYFKVAIENGMLHVSYDKREEEEQHSYLHREEYAGNFNRSFKLSEGLLKDNIQASYEEGVLTIILPKDPNAVKPSVEVKID